MQPRVIEAREDGASFLSWLYCKANDEVRGGRPFIQASRAVADAVPYNYNRQSKETEWFDLKNRVWHRSGGEVMITGDAISRVLVQTFKEYQLEVCEEKRRS